MKKGHIRQMENKPLICDSCKNKKCSEGEDCFNIRDQIFPEYKGDNLKLACVSSRIEGQY